MSAHTCVYEENKRNCSIWLGQCFCFLPHTSRACPGLFLGFGVSREEEETQPNLQPHPLCVEKYVFEIIHYWTCMCVLNCLLFSGTWMYIPPLKNWLASSGLSTSHAWHCMLLVYPLVRAYFSRLRYGFRIPFGHLHKELSPNRQKRPLQWLSMDTLL